MMIRSKLCLENFFYLFLVFVLGYNSYLLLGDTFEKRRLNAFIEANHDHYLYDLSLIKKALERFYADHGSYPKNNTFDGVLSCWGVSTVDWIPGLAPEYINELPINKNEIPKCGNQYLYRSDGKGYKLIAHSPKDCEQIKLHFPSIIDPLRNCFAYGFWNEDGKNF